MKVPSSLRDALRGIAEAVIFVVACLLLLYLGGCANVQMSDEERKACRDAETGCAVFTEAELDELVQRALKSGYRKGWTDALRQRQNEI